MCVSLSYLSEWKLITLFSVCGNKFAKIKFLCWVFCCLILCQHMHLKVCIITVFHFVLLLQFIKCTVWVHHNISKIPSKVWPSIYTCFTSNSPMTKNKKGRKERKKKTMKKKKKKKKKEEGAWVKVIMGSRFSGMRNEIYWFVLTNIFEVCSFLWPGQTFTGKTVCEGVVT